MTIRYHPVRTNDTRTTLFTQGTARRDVRRPRAVILKYLTPCNIHTEYFDVIRFKVISVNRLSLNVKANDLNDLQFVLEYKIEFYL